MEGSSTPIRPGVQLRQHIPQLDGLRGLAILMVTAHRFGREVPELRGNAWLHQAIEIGSHGVELFFVLSGFLITGILLDTRGQPYQLRNFFVRRSLRILPLYFVALVICVWCIPVWASALGLTFLEQAFSAPRDQQFYLWFYLTNVQMSLVDAWCFGPLDHFWSLAVEEHFYLVWPLVIVFCRSRMLILTTSCLTIACVVSRTGWLAWGGSATAAEVLTVWRCDGLLIGALAAMLVRSPSSTWQKIARVTQWIWVPFLALALAIDATDRRIWLVNITLWNTVWFCLLVNILTSGPSVSLPGRLSHNGLPPSHISSLQSRWLDWCFQLSWLRILGKLSYGMYVFQAPLIPLMAALGWTAGVSLPLDLLYVVSMFTLTVAIAWCSWHGFEKHWLQLKNYFPQSSAKELERSDSSGLEAGWGQVRPTVERATMG